MKTFFVIIDKTNSRQETCYVGTQNNNITTLISNALIFTIEEDALKYASELGEWARVLEERYFFIYEKTFLTKLHHSHGHWKIVAHAEGYEHSIITNDSLLIDDVFNCEDGQTVYYDSVFEARQAMLDLLNA